MNSKALIEDVVTVVFSTSLDIRNFLRNQVGEGGFSAVCFENESICYDNLQTIRPEVVIAETDRAEVIWRFVFALHAIDTAIPLLVVSDRLKVGSFSNNGLQVAVKIIAMKHVEARRLKKAIQTMKGKRFSEKRGQNNHRPFLVGHTEAITKIRSVLTSIAGTPDPVLISGEQGTGKEVLARQIACLNNGDQHIIKIDCGNLKPDMLANATLNKILSMGKNGSRINIFLDHIDKLSKASQAEMLLLIEASKQMGNGTEKNIACVIRFIASADKKIERLVEKGGFRQDLFYRLNVIPIDIPPLRERKADIPLLMDYFIINACTEHQKCIKIPSKRVREICTMHNWPGNVKELQNQMYRIVKEGREAHLLTNPGIFKEHKDNKYMLNRLAAEELTKSYEIKDYLTFLKKKVPLKNICDELVAKTERRLLLRALESTKWNRKKAAELLNISYKSILNKIKMYDVL